MKADLLVNNSVIRLNRFTQSYIANVICAVLSSLKVKASEANVCIDSEDVRIYTEKGELDMQGRDFAKQLIVNTIKGMLSPLKGVLWLERITIAVRGPGTAEGKVHGR